MPASTPSTCESSSDAFGLPLWTVHPLRPTGATAAAKTTWGGVFSLFFKGKTWPSLSLPADIGTYTAHSVVGSTLEIWKDWYTLPAVYTAPTMQ